MRVILTWLLVFGVLAGLHGRVLGADPCEVIASMHEAEHAGHSHVPGKSCDPSHDQKCPLEHHNQGSCSHCMPMATDPHHPARIGAIAFSLLLLSAEGQSPPEAPYAELDKPPLI